MALRAALTSLLLFGLTSVSGQHERPPSISRLTNNVHHVEIISDNSSRISLECPTKGTPPPEITWYKDDVSIRTNDPEGILINNELLEIENPNLELHSGYYHCKATNEFGTAKSEVVLVTDKFPKVPDTAIIPEFIDQPESEYKPYEGEVTLKCSAKGEPEPDIIWSKNGVVQPEFNDKKVITIERMNSSDVATYACNASNMYGYDYKVIYLDILTEAPRINEPPRNQTVPIGHKVVLRCSATGYPSPDITWKFNGKNAEEFREFETTSAGTLTIFSISTAHSEGSFVCFATNSLGTTESSAKLIVVSKTTIEEGPSDTKAKIHENVTLNCKVLWDQSDDLVVKWKKDNVDLSPDGLRVSVTESHALVIKDVGYSDAGTYTCVASARMTSDSDSGTLEVMGNPPVIVDGISDIRPKEGTDIILPCKAEGDPKPKISWYKGTARLPPEGPNWETDPEDTLTIRKISLSDSAKYVCRADNGLAPFATSSGFVVVLKESKIVQGPSHVLLNPGGRAILDCHVNVDENINDTVKLEWRKGDKVLEVTPFSESGEYFTPDSSDSNEYPNTEQQSFPKYILFKNSSLLITEQDSDDVGEYKCIVTTPIDEIVLSASIYTEESWLWIIILMIIIVCVLILILFSICVFCVRRKAKRQGKYGVKDVESSKMNAGIQYSIDDDIDPKGKSLLDHDKSANTPIFVSKNTRQSSNLVKGSEGSLPNLLDEDVCLTKGMDEDGSFRGRYMD